MSILFQNSTDFLANPEIPGHEFMKPAIWLDRSISSLISPISKGGMDGIIEVIKKIFLSLVIILAFFPVALFSLIVALPVKAFGSYFLYDPSIKKPAVSPMQPLPRKETKPTPTKIPPPENTIALSTAQVKEKVRMEPDGNCAFSAFLEALKREGIEHDLGCASDIRLKTAEWMEQHLQNDPELKKRLIDSLFEYIEQRRGSPPRNMEDHLARALESGSLEQIDLLVKQYLKDIKADRTLYRVFANRAHYYALSKILPQPVRIELYTPDSRNHRFYKLTDSAGPENGSTPCVRLLHNGVDHIDLLILN